MEQFLHNFPHLYSCSRYFSVLSLHWIARWFPAILDSFSTVSQALLWGGNHTAFPVKHLKIGATVRNLQLLV